MRAPSLSLALALTLLLACGPPTGSTSDASTDAGIDAPRDAARPDTGMCTSECPTGDRCCPDVETGQDLCVDLATDVSHCGVCGRDCVALRRGDVCLDYQCSCGSAEVGCTGRADSICCPASPAGGGQAYCANLQRDPTDCGRCGFACEPDRANQCEGGSCTCGLSGSECEGTPTSRCCARDADPYQCVDTTSARDHCGDCGIRCAAFEQCEAGRCVSTLPDANLVDAAAPDASAAGSDAGVDAR